MMKSRNLVWVLLLILAFGCEKEESLQFSGYTLEIAGSGGTTVELYLNEQDFWNRENAIFNEVIEQNPVTMNRSFVEYHFVQPQVYWMYAENEAFNNLREGHGCSQTTGFSLTDPGGKYHTPTFPAIPKNLTQSTANGYTMSCRPNMSRTPTRLQIQVLNNGLGIEGAEVQLYFSEQAYIDDIPAHQELDILQESYVYGPYATQGDKEIFNQTTDSEGYVLFDDLEPKQYWLRVTKDDMTNDAGTINLTTGLPDNRDITTSITVGIN